MNSSQSVKLFTIGYEGRPIEEFIELLSSRGITAIIDVRENPYSRNRQYSRRSLEAALAEAGIEYIHLKSLGSPKYLRDRLKQDHDYESFNQAYNDYLNTQIDTLSELYNLLTVNTICLICLEHNPAHCHRHLIAERLRQRFFDKSHLEIINL